MYREDIWKVALAVVAVAGAIASHALALPANLLPYAPDIEFVCGAVVIVSAVYVNKPGGSK